MERRFLVIKDKICGIIIKGWYFNLDKIDEVYKEAPIRFTDFCQINNLDETNFFWEITK